MGMPISGGCKGMPISEGCMSMPISRVCMGMPINFLQSRGLLFSSFLHTVQIQITKQVMHGSLDLAGT